MIFYLIKDFLCEEDTNEILEHGWRNSSSVPHVSECAQHLHFSWLPAVFLMLATGITLLDLKKSSNPPIQSYSPITYRIGVCIILLIDLTISFLYNLYNLAVVNGVKLYLVGDIVQYIGLSLALVLLIACRNRGIVTSGVLFLYWFLMAVCGFPEFRFGIVQLLNDNNDIDRLRVYLYLFFYALVCLELLLSSFADTPSSKFIGANECPELHSSFLSQITFHWFNGMALKAYRKPLEKSDLWNLNERDSGAKLYKAFEKNFQKEMTAYQERVKQVDGAPISPNLYPSIYKALFWTFKGALLEGAFFKLLFDLMQFIAPELLRQLINFIQDPDQPLWIGIALAATMFISAFVQTLVLHHYFHIMFRFGMNIRSVLTTAVYRKTLRLSNNARRNRTLGEIVNLMSVDVQRFQDMTNFIMLLWSAPLQVCLATFFLFRLLGVAVIAGLLILLLLIPFNCLITRKMRNFQNQQMKHKDNRCKMMSEILNGIKVLKLYAWEASMQQIVLDIRNKEVSVLKKLAYLNTATTFSLACAPFLVAVLTFGVYVSIDPVNNILTPQVTFVGITLFNILRFPLASFAVVVNNAVSCNVCNRRLKDFFASEEMDTNCITNRPSENAISISYGNFYWNTPEEIILQNLNLNIKKGSLVAVVGRVGSGKSSLLQAVLGEMNKHTGTVNVNGNIAYVSQQPWIQNMSLKDNITFNRPFDGRFYDQVVNACALSQDIAILPEGDQTEIGEKGINLSGGQKQRVSLARAIYAKADILLMDDPLSAVDSHVGKHIFENVISSSTGILAGTTRVLVTHGLHYLKYCDHILVFKEGTVSETGTYEELLARQGAFSELIEEFLVEEARNRGRSVSFGEDSEDVSEILKEIDPDRRQRIQSQLSVEIDKPEKLVNGEAKIAGVPSKDDEKEALLGPQASKKGERGRLIEKEKVETGQVSVAVYWTYIKAIGLPISMLFIGVYIFSSILGVGSYIWLAHWSDDAARIQALPDGRSETNERLFIYTGLGLGQAIFVCSASVIMALGGVRASRLLHEGMLTNILASPMSFFDTTPIGRILNRFAKDIDAVDSTVPNSVRMLVSTAFSVLATIIVIIVATPTVVIPLFFVTLLYFTFVDILVMDLSLPGALMTIISSVVQTLTILFVPVYATPLVTPVFLPVLVMYYYILDIDNMDTAVPRSLIAFVRTAVAAVETLILICFVTPEFFVVLVILFVIYFTMLRFYVSASRQLKRLESASKSPIFSHFQESIQGASSIRAYKCVDRFVEESQRRVDDNLSTYYPSIVANRWLAVRLELIGSLIVLFAALFSAIYRDTPGLTAGLVGLSVSYALNITQTLNWAVRMASELETNIVSVERIKEYTETPREGFKNAVPVDSTWPHKGEVKINSLSLRYREGLDLVLKNLTAHISPGEKVGIVGRTGAGKSSLTLALFRIVEADGGSIEIDGMNVADLALPVLRSRLTIVPQDPVLFSGTLRVNLDPFYAFDDDAIWNALKNAHLDSFVSSLPEKLNHAISEGGENLSVGQRQLICLARALLRKTKILILDEAAAAVDVETDALLQRTIREQFKDCTVLTIAHRLNTVMDSDRLLVLDRGEVAQFDSPKALLANISGTFYSMAKDAGIAK